MIVSDMKKPICAATFSCTLKCASHEKNAVLKVFTIPIEQKPRNFLLINVFLRRFKNGNAFTSQKIFIVLYRADSIITKPDEKDKPAFFVKKMRFGDRQTEFFII